MCRCFVLYKSVSVGQKKSKVLTAFTAVDFHVVRTREKTSFQHKGGGVGPDLVTAGCGDDPAVVRIATKLPLKVKAVHSAALVLVVMVRLV